MAFEITERKDSETRKRFDLKIEVQPLFRRNWSFGMRVVAREALTEEELESIIEYTIANKDKWRECKNNCVLNLSIKNATAFIKQEEKLDGDERQSE